MHLYIMGFTFDIYHSLLPGYSTKTAHAVDFFFNSHLADSATQLIRRLGMTTAAYITGP